MQHRVVWAWVTRHGFKTLSTIYVNMPNYDKRCRRFRVGAVARRSETSLAARLPLSCAIFV